MRKTKAGDRHGRWQALAGTCLAAGVILAVAFATGWRKQQAHFGDFLVQLAPKPVMPVGVALVGMDNSSLNLDNSSPEQIAASPSLTAMKRGYPWSRAVYADAIEKLLDAGARLVFLDVVMRGPREGDEDLRKALEKYGDRVVLVSTFAEDVSGAGQVIVRYQLPHEGLLTSGKAHVGFANFWRDEDGVVRVSPFSFKRPGSEQPVPSAAAVMLGLLAGKERQAALPAEAAFIPGKQAIQETMLPMWKLFDPATWSRDCKNGEVFRNKIVAIGAYFSDAHDEFPTAAGGGLMPGVAMHLAVLAAAWEGAFYSTPGAVAKGLTAFLAAMAAWIVALLFRNIVLRAVVYGCCLALALAGGVAALVWLHVQIPLLPLLAGLIVGGVGTLIVDLIAEGKARHHARRILERYVSPDVVREILDRRDSFLESLGGSRRDVTVLFADLRGFTTLAESMEPADLLAELNDYLGRMTSIIYDAGGGVDKFLGDGILAVWGTLEDSSAAQALNCSRRMLEELAALNVQRTGEGKPEWRLGIGIHKGPVLFGNVGSHKKMEPTVIGDTVNLASRTEGLNKSYGTEILFTRSVRGDCGGDDFADCRPVDRIRVMGRSRAVDLFTVWEPAIPSQDRLAYEQSVENYRAGRFLEAAAAFESLRSAHPGDTLCELYAARCRAALENPPEEPWDGVSHAKSK